MPCKCAGVRYESCACRVVGGYQGYGRSQDKMVFLAQESVCRVRRRRSNLWFKIYENLYERCAGYNLRYCPLRGVGTKNFLSEALRDLVMLFCFFMANMVVFLTIFARLTVHMSFAIVASTRWLRRYMERRLRAHKEAKALSLVPAEVAQDFSPTHMMCN